jgi:hypothetical protein
MERSFCRDRVAYFRKNGAHLRKLFGLKPLEPKKKA